MVSEMDRLHQVELGIMAQILRIVERHNLRYYLLGGTLLGAVRHRGFIPWDDDMDIGLPRPDYERFVELARTELEAPYQLHAIDTATAPYSYYYVRIEDPRVKLIRRATVARLVIPSFVDVFPLDGVPAPGAERDRWVKQCRRAKQVFTFSQYRYLAASDALGKKRSMPVELARKAVLALHLYKLVSPRRAWKRLDTLLRRYDYDTSDYLINFCGFWGTKELFPKTLYGEGKAYQFENLQLMGPQDYDSVLTQMYGDYMTPPPEADRDHHNLDLLEDF